jgi:WD40 repeat protein
MATGEMMAQLAGHRKQVTGVSFGGNGRLLAAKSADNSVSIWRMDDTPQIVARLAEPHSQFAFAGLAFSPQAPVLATLGDKDKVIRIWDLDYSVWL